MPRDYSVNFNPIETPALFQQMAQEGYGQNTLRDLLSAQAQGIQGQFMGQRDQLTGNMGRRGLYNSSIYQNQLSGLLGNRQNQVNLSQQNLWKENQGMMLQGQQLLNQIQQYNQSGQMQANQFNQQMTSDWDQFNKQMRFQQAQLAQQRSQARQQMWSGLASGMFGGLMSFLPNLPNFRRR